MNDNASIDAFREGDKVRHIEFEPHNVGEIIAVYADGEADVVWPWSKGKSDAACMKLKDLVKA